MKKTFLSPVLIVLASAVYFVLASVALAQETPLQLNQEDKIATCFVTDRHSGPVYIAKVNTDRAIPLERITTTK